MSINSNFTGVSWLAMILAAGLLAACGDIQLQGPKPTLVDPELPHEDGDVGTLNASAAFPEGAESLVLSIKDDNCYHTMPIPAGEIPYEKVGSGMGLRTIAKPEWNDCESVHYTGGSVDAVANEGQKQSVHVIHIQRGEEVKPILLRAGTYTVRAEFFDASKQLLYTGSELFSIINGDSTKVTIRLKKIEAGEVTIGFEIEKPQVMPTQISGGSHVELRRRPGFGLTKRLVEDVMDIDLSTGVAVLSAVCLNGKAGTCQGERAAKKISLTKTAIRKINEILTSVSLKSGQDDRLCVDDFEYIALVLKRCQECESGKQYKFSNAQCGNPYHTLNSKQFTEIRNAVIGFNVPFETAANH